MPGQDVLGVVQCSVIRQGSVPDGWEVLSLRIEEGMSLLYSARVELLMPNDDLVPENLLGAEYTVTWGRGEGDPGQQLHGIVWEVERLETRVATYSGGRTRAALTLAPALRKLSLERRTRVFHKMKTSAVIDRVLSDAGLDAPSYAPAAIETLRYDTVQYEETSLDFVLRLIEDEGRTFYFTHEGSKETMKVVDLSDPNALTAADVVRWAPLEGTASETAIAWSFESHHAPVPTTAKVVDLDSRFDNQLIEATGDTRAREKQPGKWTWRAEPRITPGQRARLRAGELDGDGERVTLLTNAMDRRPGVRFTLDGEGSLPVDTSVEMLLLRVEHTAVTAPLVEASLEAAQVEPLYRNRVEATTAEGWRPPRVTPRPRIDAPQLAEVLAVDDKDSSEFMSRVAVQIRLKWGAEKPAEETLWARVEQPLAHAGHGTLVIPRVGSEAVVSFLDGDPERPVVTGCLYTRAAPSFMALPDKLTTTAVHTGGATPNGGVGHELYVNDLSGSELLQAKCPLDVDVTIGQHETVLVKGNSTRTVEKDDAETVKGKRTVKVTGNDTYECEANVSATVKGKQFVQVNDKHQLSADNGLTLVCGQSRIEMTPSSIELKIGGSKVKMESASVEIVSGASKVKLSATSVEVESGAGKVAVGPAAVNINNGALEVI